MGIFSWFSKSPSPDYETLLSRLASEVQDAKIHLSEIRLRERRFSLLINAYGIALWAVWVGLWYLRGLPWGLVGWNSEGMEAKAVGVSGILAGPVFIWGLNRLVYLYFTRQRNVEETHLRKLLAEQKKQVDAIKKATNYDSTRKLIEQYDLQNGMNPQAPPNSSPSTPRRSPETPTKAGKQGQGQPQSLQGSPRAPGHLTGAAGTPMQAGQSTPVRIPEGMSPQQVAAVMQAQQMSIQPVLPTPEKKWYDRVVDQILGEDPSQAPQSKYALVCGECFRHNGLVGGKYEWERMQWICPRCNHLNPAPLSKSKSPTTPSIPTLNLPNQQSSQPTPQATPPASNILSRQNASPRPRRQLSETSTPRSSRLGKAVFSASDHEEEDDDDSGMEVDEKS